MKKALFSALLVGACFTAEAGMVVIGNPQGVDSITQAEVKNLYLGKTPKLANGANAHLYELAEGTAERDAFHAKTTGRNDAQLQSNWSRLVFTGKAVAPDVTGNAGEMIEAVKTTPNAIGYIDEAQVTSDIKVLLKL